MKPGAVIFDRDGVLTYFDIEAATAFFQPLVPMSLAELAQRWQRWGGEVGFPATLEQEQTFFAGFWQMLRQECNLTESHYQALRGVNYSDFMHLFPEVHAVLRELKQRGVAIGVLSNFSLASLETSLEAVGIHQWIDVACAATVIGYAKPHPEAYLHVARRLGMKPEQCIFLDDEMPCVAGAQKVGMTAYLVDRKRSQDDRANSILHSLNAVIDFFL
jgi:putative hydrolase of the HAD superfamily